MTARARPWKDKEWLVQRYIVEGRDLRDIAREAKCHHSALSYWLARHGIEARKSNRVLHQIKCPECGEMFNVTQTEIDHGRTFCSHECSVKSTGRKKTVEHVIKKCLICGKELEVRPSETNKKYCSKKCYADAMSNREIRVCPSCGKEFEAKPSDPSTFCSRDCFHVGHRAIYTCEYCGKEFVGMKCRTWLHFCSSDCREKYREKYIFTKRTCKNCGRTFRIRRSDIKSKAGNIWGRTGEFCTRKCHVEWQRGPNHPAWKGGHQDYPPEFNNKFRLRIRRRDNYTCAICQLKGISVHHINYVKGDTTPENCITLCRRCHSKTNSNREYWEHVFIDLMIKRDLRKELDITRRSNSQTRLPGF